MKLLRPCLPKLSTFSIGCIEDLTYFLDDILKNLSPSKVTHLGLASVKDDPVKYEVAYFDLEMIAPFTKLKVKKLLCTQCVEQHFVYLPFSLFTILIQELEHILIFSGIKHRL